MFSLSALLDFDDITIQCHDNPDADSIASGFALYTFLDAARKKVRLVYSGRSKITKVNLLELLRALSVPLEHVKDLPEAKALVLVDCQYGAGNVTKFPAETIVVIDHHRRETSGFTLEIIRPQLGSCSTLVWDLLKKQDFDFCACPDVSTALYYGLFSDTNNFAELSHPLDKDMRDSLCYDSHVIKKLKNSNLTLTELRIAGTALTRYKNNRDLGYAIFKAEPCDPNILGFISDLALQVNSIDICIVYACIQNGIKLSIRSCSREVMANEFIAFLTEGVGSGGGHIEKAGGFIQQSALDGLKAETEDFLEARAQEYMNAYDVVDAANHALDITGMAKYNKKKIPTNYVMSADIFAEGTPILIRTLEGDAEAIASKDVYLMIGILGEVYPIQAGKFWVSYEAAEDSAPGLDYSYAPTVRNKLTGDSADLLAFAKPCLPLTEVHIRAAVLTRNTKIFTAWNAEGYMSGKPGDFIAVRDDDPQDVYIVRKDIFEKTYKAP
ncbi:MAG: DHH family phosphoesterase [Clostridiales Family XIII bacterium]|jgi:phosphoglycolate phosphatase|nr:DHH family phosphoesterase [Clostridiales Family XIII bacterium]